MGIPTKITTGLNSAMEDFMIRAGLAGLAVAMATGPLGALIVWRRMAFFGDAIAHASVLGVGLALLLSAPIGLGSFAIALVVGVGVAMLMDRGQTGDASLGVLSHASLALGLVVLAILPGRRVNIEAFLFGDILTVSWNEVGLIVAGALLIVAVVKHRWPSLLISTLNEDMAVASGVNPSRERLFLTVLLALLVAIALKVVGALLVAALLIIPAAGAQLWARSPEGMAIGAAVIGAVSVVTGLAFSYWLDSPAGPSIVAIAAVCYAIGLGVRRG